MCGRYTVKTDARKIQEELGLDEPPVLAVRYNVAPTQAAPVVLSTEPRKVTLAQWGLIPHWAPSPSIASRLINARGDSVAEKPAFREAFAQRRCLVIADGFYEWQQAGKTKQPFFIHYASDKPFTFAGLWETWHSPAGLDVVSFTIVTTEADAFMSKLHTRMPVMLSPNDRATWLAPTTDVAVLKALIHPGSPEPLAAYEVEPYVNAVAHDDPRCLEPARVVQLPLL